jgi:hypothetical protein
VKVGFLFRCFLLDVAKVALTLIVIRRLPGWAGPSLKQRGLAVAYHIEALIGVDTAKLRNAVAIAESGLNGQVYFFGEIDNTEAAMRKSH